MTLYSLQQLVLNWYVCSFGADIEEAEPLPLVSLQCLQYKM